MSTPTPRERAERRVIRAAMGIVNAEGWSFQHRDGGVPIALFPNALRRLENAIANLRSVRNFERNKKRRNTHGR